MATEEEKRKLIEEKIISIMDILDPAGDNSARYRNIFANMGDQEFSQFMNDIKNKRVKLTLFAPNMSKFIQQEDCIKAADALNVKLFEKLEFKDKATGKYFLTPNEYMILKLPVRRTRQFLMHKLSIAENDKKIDMLTGQVTGDDKASSLSFVEAQLLYARGLDNTLIEFMKIRGGDIHAFATFKQQLEESGSAKIESLDPTTLPRSTVVMNAVLKAMYFDNNLVEV